MSGGQNDLGEGDTGQQLYDDAVAYANARRAAGFTHVIITTIPASLVLTSSGYDDERQDFNTIVQADPDGAFDAVVDWAVGILEDPESDGPGQSDGLGHFTIAGAEFAAQLVAPTLETILSL